MGRAFVTKDFLAGVMFVAFGLLGLWLGRTLEAGTASAMEAGYFPRLICGLLIAIGAAPRRRLVAAAATATCPSAGSGGRSCSSRCRRSPSRCCCGRSASC